MINIFIRRFVIFFIPLGILFGTSEYYLKSRTKSNEILAKVNLVKSNAPKETVFIGNSHCRNAIIPNDLSFSSINLCMSGSLLNYDLETLERFILKNDDIKRVVWNISYHSLYFDESRLNDNSKFAKYHHYLGSELGYERFDANFLSASYLVGLKGIIRNLKNDFSGTSIDFILSKGFNLETSVYRPSKKKNIEVPHHAFMSVSSLLDNMKLVDKVTNLCKSNGKDLVIITCPVSNQYRNSTLKEFNGFNMIIDSFAVSNSLRYINLQDSMDVNSSHFVNLDHLNISGAKLCSTKLDSYLQE